MSFVDAIAISSDEEDDGIGGGAGGNRQLFVEEPLDVKDFDVDLLLPSSIMLGPPPGFSSITGPCPKLEELAHVKLEADVQPCLAGRIEAPRQLRIETTVPKPLPPPRLCRQFWKSGDYHVAPNAALKAQNGRNRLRINPRFLHSNATSHKWAFGALAELLDNAIDEVNNGATYVKVDKFTNLYDNSPALIVEDDGGGMTPESLRSCMSFGFSDKQSEAFIGQYGNGFKTSTMRLGADVIVFTRSCKEGKVTRSVGLLSYTFLRETGADDILVPAIDYIFNAVAGSFGRLLRHDEKQFDLNLSIILKWSPFTTEEELTKQFDGMGDHGTKIIVFNLWYNDEGKMELDFDTDEKDILINGAYKPQRPSNSAVNCIANRFRHSLRAYASILYLHLPENYMIILRGEFVQHHLIANDLMYRECILYRPHVGGIAEGSVVTTIGFHHGAPNVDVQGFNVYHKKRLILPFWRVASNSYGKGRGVVGILETNFIKPTHDKQDFERSTLFQKLEARLKEMTYEYWDLYCHLVGYDNKKLPKMSGASVDKSKDTVAAPSIQSVAADVFPQQPPMKRKQDYINGAAGIQRADRRLMLNPNGTVKLDKTQPQRGPKQRRFNEIRAITTENKKLRQKCLELEAEEKELVLKEKQLRLEVEKAQKVYSNLLGELESVTVKAECA